MWLTPIYILLYKEGIHMKRVFFRKLRYTIVLSLIAVILTGTIGFNEVKVSVYPWLRDIQHRIIDHRTRNFNIRETEHFVIKYEEEAMEDVDLVALAAEDKYNEITEMFKYSPEKKVTVILYDNPQKLMDNANLKQSKPPMGVYYASTIQILSPNQWIPENQDMEYIFINQGPMVHEFTHLIVDDLTRGNYPLWFTEGLALYQEYVQTGYEWGRNMDYDDQPYTVEELTEEFSQLDETLAYKRSFELVRNLAEREGFDSLLTLLGELQKGKSFEEANYAVFGGTVESIYEGR
jgi:hypothetical protein